jgi:hypothetical protein
VFTPVEDDVQSDLALRLEASSELNIEFSPVQLRGQQLVAAVSLAKSFVGGRQEAMKP